MTDKIMMNTTSGPLKQQLDQEIEELATTRVATLMEIERGRAQSERKLSMARMAAHIAHKINNPLAGIKMAFELIKDIIPIENPCFEYVGKIDKEISRMAETIRQTYEMYRPEYEKNSKFDVSDIIKDVIQTLEPLCRQHDISIKSVRRGGISTAFLPKEAFRQVLHDILQNAVEASAPRAFVKVVLEKYEDKIYIKIVDQGSGIAENMREKIFEPFFTTKSGPLFPHMGLGLAHSMVNIQSMSGSFTFKSKVDFGTVFKIIVPAGNNGGGGREK